MAGKNITLDELLKYIYNISNIPGMDNVFGHIVNSTHNGALFILVEKLLNGTGYGNLFDSIKDVIIYPYKEQIIRLIYEILKSGLLITDNEPKDEEKINKIRNTLESIRNFINSIKNIIYENREDILDRANLTSLYDLTTDIFDENSTFIDDLFNLIEEHPELVNHIVTLIKGGLTGDITKFIVLDTIKKIFNVEGFKELIIDKLKKNFYDIVPLIPKEVNERPTVIPLLIDLKDFIMKYQDRLVDFIYQIFTHYMNYTEIAKDINNFIIDCNGTNFLKDLRNLVNDKALIKRVIPLINFDNEISNTVVKKAISDEKLMNLALDLLNNQTFINSFVGIFLNLHDKNYINKHLVKFIQDTIGDNKETKKIILNSFQNIVRNVLTEDGLKNTFSNIVSALLKVFSPFDDKIISGSCSFLFNHTYLNPPNNNTFKYYYTKKLFIDSTKSKNDFLTYENCLNGDEKSNYSTTYQIKPIFVGWKNY